MCSRLSQIEEDTVFSIHPWNMASASSNGAELTKGTGRWKKLVVGSASVQVIDQIVYISFFFTCYLRPQTRIFFHMFFHFLWKLVYSFVV